MNKLLIPVLASVLILGVISSQQVFAPEEQPEKLNLGGNGWNAETQSFEITGEINRGIAKAIEKADFTIFTTLTIADDSGNKLGLTSNCSECF